MTDEDIKGRAIAIAQDLSDDHTDDDDIARAVRDICKLVAEAVSEVKTAPAGGVRTNRKELAKATKNYHLCLDVRGALLNWTNHELGTCFTHDDGRKMTAREAKLALTDELAKGHKVIPTCACDNFDYQHGCNGHPDLALRESDESVCRNSLTRL